MNPYKRLLGGRKVNKDMKPGPVDSEDAIGKTLIKPQISSSTNATDSGATLVKPLSTQAAESVTRVNPTVNTGHSRPNSEQERGPIPSEALQIFNQAEAASRRQDWSEAAAKYKQALDTCDGVPEAWCQYGLVLNNLGRFGEAETAFRRSIELDPRLANAYGNLGVLLVRDLNRPDEAEQMFLKALEIDPNHNARNNLAILRQQRGGASVTRPEDERLPPEEEREADRLEERRMEGAALAIYLEFLRTHPRSLMALNNAAMLHLKIQQAGKALALLEKAVELDPGYVKAWNNLGVANFQIGDMTKAKSAFERALSLQPTNETAKRGLQSLSSAGAPAHPIPKTQKPLVCVLCGTPYTEHAAWRPDNRVVGGARCRSCKTFYCQFCIERAMFAGGSPEPFACRCGCSKTSTQDLGNFEEMAVFRL